MQGKLGVLQRTRSLWACAVCYLLVSLLGAGPVQADKIDNLKAAMRTAAGGALWDRVEALQWEASLRASGFAGRSTGLIDRYSQQFKELADLGVLTKASGIDAGGPWQGDYSGGVHGLQADEAQQVFASHAWLYARRWLDVDDGGAWSGLGIASEGSRLFWTVTVTPKGGRTLVLWIDQTSHLIDRAELDLAIFHETIRYGGYEQFAGLTLPTAISVDVGDPGDADILTVERWTVIPKPDNHVLQRPKMPDDSRVTDGKSSSTSPLILEGNTLLVMASINDGPPMRFVLDTGGHAILTPEAASQLGLVGSGGGQGYGAGSGSTTEQYVRTERFAIGTAEITGAPFIISPQPYISRERGNGEQVAGILGLEVFERFAVALDYAARTVTLTPLAQFAPPQSGVAVPIKFADDCPLIDGSLNGLPGIIAIDTGNSGDPVIQGRFARRTGLDKAFEGGIDLVSTGQGGDAVSTEARLDELGLGPVRLAHVLARVAYDRAGAFSSRSEAANVGESILRLFKVTFDYRRVTMTLERQNGSEPPPFPRAGVQLRKLTPDAFTATVVAPGGPAINAGIEQGSKVVAVDGTDAADLAGSDIWSKLRQSPGTVVNLTLEKAGERRTVSLTLQDTLP